MKMTFLYVTSGGKGLIALDKAIYKAYGINSLWVIYLSFLIKDWA